MSIYEATDLQIKSGFLELICSSLQEENGNDDLYEKLERAMVEAANAKREAYEELLRRQKSEKNAIEASRRVSSYALQSLNCEHSAYLCLTCMNQLFVLLFV